ncbi:3-phosphoshikimate 1-carboxyvinyltransferase [Nostoc edaphicum CCNP1411]|uniref:3-phosphoshikimate 1-carboxyvinyltransferase n=1 Tax=Nostoc edaphicum CCNP1411 TaxID=1472755 RepID=A0A7D7LBJ8_9NOSO|nr:3-phosphoshikimate 1-carboxyvinyltransferase [Nostoc edaphicum]QMS88068.1 3-phosphoshikimate 1-carboxyvinyltransferase [Nostoc edaphicum CCNP1411]
MDTIAIPALNRPVDATVEIPGSKSLTNRALLVAALAQGDSILENALFSEDSEYFAKCVEQLGIPITLNPNLAQIQIAGRGGEIPAKQADLFVGLSGTTARFISALVALGNGEYRLDGVPRMRERPMGDMLTVLQTGGATVNFEENSGFMPYTLYSQGFAGGNFCLKANQTSQQLSALLMIAPYAQQDTIFEVEGTLVSQSYIKMTCSLMADFGVEVIQIGENQFQIKAGQRYQARHYTIEPDASNASYFFAAAAVTGGRVRVKHLTKQSCQGDILWLNVLEQMGCQINDSDDYTEVTGPKQLQGIDIDMNDISDLVQTLAAIAPFASSPITIRNVEHIRYKETDRIKAVVTELRRLGVKVEEFADRLKIEPGPITPAAIETYHDHRMAMAFAVTGLKVPGIVIKDPGCTAKTFPDYFTRFFQMLEQ